MNGHPAVDVHRQVPRPLTLTQLTDSHPVDGDRSREKKISGLILTVLCKPTHFFFHSFIATKSYPLQTSFISVMKGWADKFHAWGTPTRSPSRSNSR